MQVEFLNLNDDPLLDPEVKPVVLSQDSKRMPPSYCLPWVEASRYSIQLKSNADYVLRKTPNSIEAWVLQEGKRIPYQDFTIPVPEGMPFVPKSDEEALEKKVRVSRSPSFSSPWQQKHRHSMTLKLGIYWWTPPEWGLFFTSAVHRNEEFRVVEGMVRTDIWHRDVPVVIQPLVEEVRIPKYSVIASAILVSSQDIQLVPSSQDEPKRREVIDQVSKKRLRGDIYKRLLRKKKDLAP